MPFWRSYAHLVWATKARNAWIHAAIEPALYAYLTSKASELDCFVHALNGMPDHVHFVISIPPKHSVAWVVKMLKGASAHFVNHTLRPGAFHFAWQRGYGYLTLGESQCGKAVAYVEAQKTHHQLHTTNSWLERYSELDEGPTPTSGVEIRQALREEQPAYHAIDAPPF